MVEMRRLGTAGIANPKTTDQIRKCKKSDWSETSIRRDREVQRKAKRTAQLAIEACTLTLLHTTKNRFSFWRRLWLRC
jgi:hypothetical protein